MPLGLLQPAAPALDHRHARPRHLHHLMGREPKQPRALLRQDPNHHTPAVPENRGNSRLDVKRRFGSGAVCRSPIDTSKTILTTPEHVRRHVPRALDCWPWAPERSSFDTGRMLHRGASPWPPCSAPADVGQGRPATTIRLGLWPRRLWFESPRTHQGRCYPGRPRAPLAQLAEQRTLNPQVLGSSPRGGTHEGPGQSPDQGLPGSWPRCTERDPWHLRCGTPSGTPLRYTFTWEGRRSGRGSASTPPDHGPRSQMRCSPGE
jgi:hypothetical protein